MRAVGTRFAGQAIVGALALCVSAAFSTAWAAKAGPAVAFNGHTASDGPLTVTLGEVKGVNEFVSTFR